MKAITVHQPWAWAIAEGHKLVENRGVRINYRGEVAIHAGVTISDKPLPDRDACVALDKLGGRGNFWRTEWYPLPLRRPATAKPTLALGAVIAVAQLVDCHPATVDDQGEVCCAPWGMARYGTKQAHHLVLADVRALPEPVPVRGMQPVPWAIRHEPAVAAIRAQLERP